MDLEVRKDRTFSDIYAHWVEDDINAFEREMAKARIKKDGYFYKNDRARLFVRANFAFRSLVNYFIFTDEMYDERNALVRALETLNAEQFKAFASLIIEPYKNINPIEAT